MHNGVLSTCRHSVESTAHSLSSKWRFHIDLHAEIASFSIELSIDINLYAAESF